MALRSWVRNLLTRPVTRPSRRALSRPRPALEVLEDRWCPSTYTVDRLGDSGAGRDNAGDLRYCINQANAQSGEDTIVFDPGVFGTPQTITLSGGQLELKDTALTTITGPAAGVTIDGNNATRVFQINGNARADLTGLTIKGGGGTSDRGGGLLILNGANVTLTSCTISGNTVSPPQGDQFHGGGGGLYNLGTVNLTGCTVSGNSAISVVNSVPGGGGGLYNRGTANLTGCTVSGNSAIRGGGLFNTLGAALNLINSTVSDNTIDGGRGGGLYNYGTVNLTGCTVTGNAAPDIGLDGGEAAGGGLFNDGGTVTLNDCTFSKNTAGKYGGGMYNSGGTVTIASSTFSTNHASFGGGDYYGGGLYNDSGTVTLTASTFNDNTAGGHGGGMYSFGGTVTIASSTFSANHASFGGGDWYGGGLYNDSGTVTLTASTFNDNTAGGHGGGMYNVTPASTTANVTITSSTFSNNHANFGGGDWYGGGLYNSGGILTLTASTFNSNTAGGSGGGVYSTGNADIGFALVNVINCTFTNNDGGSDTFSYGGALYTGADTWVKLTYCTITDNAAEYGGGVYTNGRLFLRNTILATNTVHQSGRGNDLYTAAGSVFGSLGNNLFGVGWADRVAPGDRTGVTAGQLKLAPLDYYGGPTKTRALTPGSIAIGNGTPVNGITTDQRGFPRNGPKVDIGAFQTPPQGSVGAAPLVVTTTSDSSGPAGGLSLRQAVNLANVVAGPQTITFDTTSPNAPFKTHQTITLLTGQLELSDPRGALTILAPAAGLTVNANQASRVFQVDGTATANLSGLTITGGTADRGGGILNLGTLTLTRCTLTGNTAGGGGGLSNAGRLVLTNCTVSANLGDNAGGGLLSSGGSAALTNCTISGNTANGGAGISSAGTLSLTNCTISGNHGGTLNGGGLRNNGGSATLINTIVASNDNAFGAQSDIGGSNVSGTYNLIGTGGSGGLRDKVDGNIVGVADPGLAALDFYGGPTPTMALLPGSPAIDRGTQVAAVTQDQRGFPRLRQRPDIGAFESQTTPLVVNTTLDTSAVPLGKLDLRGAVRLANVLSGPQAITFDPKVFATPQTITLTAGQLELTDPGGVQLITGPTAGVTISGGGQSRVFQVDQGVTANLSNLTITAGKADRAGGLLNLGTANLTCCTISGNTARFNHGGGLLNLGTANLTRCTISGNTARFHGGGLYNYGQANLASCIISNNTASGGGGLANADSVSLTGCTFSGNQATSIGGGILNESSASLTNCALFSNQAGAFGGGLCFLGATDAEVTLKACTLSGNTATTSGSGLYNGGLGTMGLTDTIVAGDITGPHSGDHNVIAGDPKLAPLGNYGGPTAGAPGSAQVLPTMALLPGSPAIAAGTGLPGVTTDQRGMARGSLVDIGAFQTTLVVESTGGSVNTTPGQLTLVGAVQLANTFGAPVAISFDPAVFTGGQTILLTGPLALSKVGTLPTWTITGPAHGVTISGGNGQGFQVNQGVTATFANLTISSAWANSGAGLTVLGTATLNNCTFTRAGRSPGGAIQVSGGSLVVNGGQITGWATGVQVVQGGAATITGVDLSGNQVGVRNNTSGPVNATLNWWGSSSGPTGAGASRAIGNVNYSPWLSHKPDLE
jgi:hypothetical protein